MLFIARTWFHCSANEVLQRVTPLEILEMQAEFNLGPWGEERADVAAATIAQTSLLPHLKEHAKPPPLSAFMPFVKVGERLPTEEELAAKVGAITGHGV